MRSRIAECWVGCTALTRLRRRTTIEASTGGQSPGATRPVTTRVGETRAEQFQLLVGIRRRRRRRHAQPWRLLRRRRQPLLSRV